MRVIAGQLKGRKLKAPSGLNTRPTTDRVKESIFSMIHPYLMDSMVLDLFSGTGSLGIEALSRGAKKAYFVDHNKQSISIIRENISNLGLLDQSVILFSDAIKALKELALKNEKFDIIFLDPPYAKGLIIPCIQEIENNLLLRSEGMIVVEHDPEDRLPEMIGKLHKRKDRRYGNTNISIYSEEA